MKQRLIKIDGKTRTDPKFPTGFMDVVQIEKTGDIFRIIYDVIYVTVSQICSFNFGPPLKFLSKNEDPAPKKCGKSTERHMFACGTTHCHVA